MKVYHLPSRILALAFDMDLTLYTNAEYGQYQTDSMVERLGQSRGLSFDEINAEVEKARETWALSHGGKKPSLSNILSVFGIELEEIVRWREELLTPEKFIKVDKRLEEALEELSRHYALGVVTNNPVLVAHKTLAALGVPGFFPIVVGLDTCMTPKPHERPFEKFCELAHCPPETCVSIGDRYDIDLDIPLGMGMGAILVDGVEDVYELPEVLGAKFFASPRLGDR
jgi:phosphoglycolate phosphatase/putative hydrolase of the HAD superfamily